MPHLFRLMINGVTDRALFKRITWLYLSFFLLFYCATILSYVVLPEGILRGKHPIISALTWSPSVWRSTLQIFAYNLIPTCLIVGSSLLAQQSRVSKDRFVPVGYTAFWGLTVMFGVVLGSWSFGIVAPAPPLGLRLVRIFDVAHHSGLLEMSAYLMTAAASFKLTLWYSNRKTIVSSRSWREVRLTSAEIIAMGIAMALLLCAAVVESHAIIQSGQTSRAMIKSCSL